MPCFDKVRELSFVLDQLRADNRELKQEIVELRVFFDQSL